MKLIPIRHLMCSAILCASWIALNAQTDDHDLPDAPQKSALISLVELDGPIGVEAMGQHSARGEALLLTRAQADAIALAHNPHIHISELTAKIQSHTVQEVRSDELPYFTGNITAVGANNGSRLSSGSLSASRMINRAGAGVAFSQLITDFGHTSNLVAASRLQEKATTTDTLATRAQIIFATEQLFYEALEAQDSLALAIQAVARRKALLGQATSQPVSKPVTALGLGFAQVGVSQATLLQLNMQNALDTSKAALRTVLGEDHLIKFDLVDDTIALAPLPPSVDALISLAIRDRPDLQSLRFSEAALDRVQKAQRDQLLPTLNVFGVVGGTPAGSSQFITTNWYGAVAANLSIPIFNGFRLSAKASETALQSQIAKEKTRALREEVVRDVDTAWLNASAAQERLHITEALFCQTTTILNLTQTRYRQGFSSLVELSHAEQQQTQAALDHLSARARYRMAISAIDFEIGSYGAEANAKTKTGPAVIGHKNFCLDAGDPMTQSREYKR